MTAEEPIDVPRELAILARSDDRDELVRAATAVIVSGDPLGLAQLGELLAQGEFLARLDALDVPSLKTRRLGQVMAALGRHPSQGAAELCLALTVNPVYLADPDRKTFLLRVLAAVRPMSGEAAAVFRAANAEGYFSLDAILLADNSSPLALDLLGEMIADRSVPADRRVDAVRFAVYPRRTQPPMLALAGRLISGDLEGAVAVPLIESIFDDRPDQWFDPGTVPPHPPRWESAATQALQQATALAAASATHPEISAGLRDQVARTGERLRAELERRERE